VLLGALVHDVNAVHGILDALGEPYPGRVTDAFARADGSVAGGTVVLGGGVRWTLAWLRVAGLGDFAERIGVYGEHDVRELEFPAPYLAHAPTRYTRSAGGGEGNVTTTLRSWQESYVRQLLHFHACVTGRAPCRTPPEQARADIACLEALHDAVVGAEVAA
jgi:predicted dehydrogenase